MKLKIAYFGTPDFSARFLEKMILDTEFDIEIVIVVTQPDKPVGRKQILTPSPVKLMAQNHNLDVFDEPISHQLSTLQSLLSNTDLCVLFAYGEIIPKSLLEAPRLGFWNIHPSLLPLYRGASPITYPLMLGDTKTGVTLMQMGEKLDDGPIIAQKTYEIVPGDTRSDLEIKLTDMGFGMFRSVILNHPLVILSESADESKDLVHKTLTLDSSATPQNDKEATYTRRLTKQDGYIDLSLIKKALNNEPLSFDELPELIKEYYKNNIENCKLKIENSSKIVYDYFRGISPWPGIWTKLTIDGVEKRLKITSMSYEMLQDSSFKLQINRVQLEGKQEVSWSQFANTSKNIISLDDL